MKIMKTILSILIYSFSFFTCYGQNGKILSREKLYQQDSLTFYKIKYLSDSVVVEGFIVEPTYKKNIPIVIFNRGGNSDYYKIDSITLTNWISPIARYGFLVFASQYRSNDEFGGADINDVLNLISIAKHSPNVDSTFIGMVGWSRGGLMTYLALTMTNEIDCAIIGGAPTDMFDLLKQRPEMDSLFTKLIPSYFINREEELKKRSPLLFAEKLNKTKLLIIHGASDTRVNSSHSIRMSERLNSIGYIHTLKVIENDDHILNLNRNIKDTEIGYWLIKNLTHK